MKATNQNDFTESSLRHWVQQQHLRPGAIAEMRRRFESRPERYFVVDDFILPERLRTIRGLLTEDGVLQTAYKVFGAKGWASEQQFHDAADEDRFIHELIYDKPREGRERSPAVVEDALFRLELKRPTFHAWLAATMGLPVDRTGPINLKRLNNEHFLRWHTDEIPFRTVCLVLYLHEDWIPTYGGRFLMRRLAGGIDTVEPLFNRLVVFNPGAHSDHAVEPMTPAAAEWARLNYTVWLYGGEDRA